MEKTPLQDQYNLIADKLIKAKALVAELEAKQKELSLKLLTGTEYAEFYF